MRTALLAVTLLCLTGCWKEIHEARAPAVEPLRTANALPSDAPLAVR